jgi:hypothetical protein
MHTPAADAPALTRFHDRRTGHSCDGLTSLLHDRQSGQRKSRLPMIRLPTAVPVPCRAPVPVGQHIGLEVGDLLGRHRTPRVAQIPDRQTQPEPHAFTLVGDLVIPHRGPCDTLTRT